MREALLLAEYSGLKGGSKEENKEEKYSRQLPPLKMPFLFLFSPTM